MKALMKLLLSLSLAALILVYPALSSAIDITLYKELRAASPKSAAGSTLRIYFRGLQDGLEFSNAAMISAGKTPLYCAPKLIALNTENYLQFVDEALAAEREGPLPLKQSYPIAAILAQMLPSKMPCPL